MQVTGSDNAGPGSYILGPELMSEGIETLLEKKKANDIMLQANFILSEIYISEWTLSIRCLPPKVVFHQESSSNDGCLPPKVAFLRRSSSTEGCLSPKGVFH